MSTYTLVEKRHKSVFRILSKGRVSLVVSGMLLGTTVSFAAPSGGNVTAGNASITSSGNVTTINQSSDKASINWQDFSIRSNETVNFAQPSASSITLNRVVGNEKSIIDGMLNANGQVFILNSNGILFGKNSSVNTAGLVASTMSMSKDDFMAGNYRFSENGSKASVINEGTITISEGGYAAFLAQSVKNGGIVSTSLGKVLLSNGEQITLNIAGNTLVEFTIDKVALEALIENHGAIYADGGEIYLTTKAVNNLVKGVVNNTGILEAQTLGTHEGKIVLWGETTNVAGILDASAPNGANGGFIETSGDHITIAEGTRVTTKASTGTTGTWLIDPTDFTVAESGGDMSGATLSSNLGSTNVLIQSALGSNGTNGDVNINDTVSWSADTILTLDAANNININADITATGANAGLAMLYSGDYNLNALITLSGVGATLNINGNAYTLIHSMADFQNINSNLSGLYALGGDISSIGTYGDAVVGNFSGVFAGMGHTISDLTINTNVSYLGLFRSNSGMIRNFGVINGSVQSTNAMIGGLVGKNTGTIQDSFYAGAVYVPYANGAGGLAAWNNGGTIIDSYSTGTVTGNDAVGGIVGYNENNGVIERTYSTATVTSLNAQRHGGIVGANNSGTVSNSYAIGQIAGGGSVSGGGVLDTDQMKNAANFSGWDIATAGGSNSKWRIYEGNSAPLLRSFLRTLKVSADSGTRTYDGTTDGFGVTYSATPDATLLGMATTTLSSKNAGTRTVSANGLYSDQQGYDVVYKNGIATINVKTISSTSSATGKTYDATTSASAATTLSGVIAGDTVTASGTGTFADKNAGSNKNVTVSGITLAGASAANYFLDDTTDTTTATIYQKMINVNSAIANDKVYDGTTTATLSAINVSGVISGDSVTTTAADVNFDTKEVGNNKNVHLSGIAVSGSDGLNYVVSTGILDTTASITEQPIVTTNITPQSISDNSAIQNGGIVNVSYYRAVSQNEHPVLLNNSIVTLVDGGMRLPDGLTQTFYVTKEEK